MNRVKQRVPLGDSRLVVSPVALGTYRLLRKLGEQTALELLDAACANGLNFFVTSDNYGPSGDHGLTEKLLGQAIESGRLPRDTVVIATKTGLPWSKEEVASRGGMKADTSSVRVEKVVEHSLRRLGVDAIDIYGLHGYDPDTTPDDIVATMNGLIEAGKILAWGVSNYNEADQINLLSQAAGSPGAVSPSALENSYNMLDRTHDAAIDAARSVGMAILAYSPLMRGALTDENLDFMLGLEDKDQRAMGEALLPLRDFAHESGHNLQQLAIAWLMRQDGVIPILGAYNKVHLDDLLRAVDWQLSDDEIAYVNQALAGMWQAQAGQ